MDEDFLLGHQLLCKPNPIFHLRTKQENQAVPHLRLNLQKDQNLIQTLMGKKIYNEDIQGRSIASMLWVFAAIETGKGNSKEAKALFNRGKAEGVTGQYLKGNDIEFYKKIAPILKPLGELD